MSVDAMMQEFGIEIDDVRWYLATVITERILQKKEHPADIHRLIWSGELERDLYDMEERYLRNMQSDLDRGLTDDSRVRELFGEIVREKRRRADEKPG